MISQISLAQSVKINVPSGTFDACLGNPTYLEFSIGGGSFVGPIFEYYYTVDGGAPIMVTGANPYSIAVSSAGTYVVVDCKDLGNGSISIGPNPGHSTEVITPLAAPTAIITPDPANTSVNTTLTLNSNTTGDPTTKPYASTTWTDGGLGYVVPDIFESTIFNSPTTSGSYNVTYTVVGANGCIGTDNVSVTVIDLKAEITSLADPASACIGSALNLSGKGKDGSGDYAYAWSYTSLGGNSCSITYGADTSFTANGADTYTLTFTVTDNGVSPAVFATTTTTIISDPAPLNDRNVFVTHYCFPDLGTITLELSEPGIDYELFDGLATIAVKTGDGSNLVWPVNPSSNYRIVATNTVTNCTYEYVGPYVIGNYTKPTVAPTVDDPIICVGTSTTLRAVALGTGGSVVETYSWDNAATLTPSSTMADPTATPVNIGLNTYTVTATDDKGCFITGSIDITTTESPVLTISGDNSICLGETTTLTATSTKAPDSWDWDGGTLFSAVPAAVADYTPTVASLGVGNNLIDLVVTDATGCSTTETFTITVNPVPFANAGLDQDMCFGIGATITGSSTGGTIPYNYSWSNGAGTASTSVNPTGLGANTYTLIVTDGNFCTSTDVVDINVKDNPTVNGGIDQFSCNGENVNLLATGFVGSPPYSYDWGTAGVGSAIIVNPINPVAGSAILVNKYFVTVSDANSCIGTDSVKVTVNAPSSIVIINDGDKYCTDAGLITMNATPVGGSWNEISGTIPMPLNTFDPALYTSGSYTFEYTYNDPATGGCTTTKQATIEILPYATPSNLDITDLNSGLYCSTDVGPHIITGVMNPDLSGQSGVIEKIISTGAGLTNIGDGTGNFNPSIAGSGIHTITYTVTTPGCSNTYSENITVGNAVNYPNMPTSMCVGDTDFALEADNILGNWKIRFENGLGVETMNTTIAYDFPNAKLSASEAGTYYITYELSTPGQYNCGDTVEVIIDAIPTVSFTIDGIQHTNMGLNFCDNGVDVNLEGSANGFPATGVYGGTGVFGGLFRPSTIASGAYKIYYTHTDPITGCSNTDTSQVITINTAPTVSISGIDPNYCNDNDFIIITGNPKAAFPIGQFTFPTLDWTTGVEYTDNLDGSAMIEPKNVSVTGGYNISYQVADLNGCTGTVTETVNINPLPTVDLLGLPTDICNNNVDITLTGSPTDANGLFTGDGIVDLGNGTANFYADSVSTGNHTITYKYTDPFTLCEDTIMKTVNVSSLPNKYTVTAPSGLEYCSSNLGVVIGVSNSDAANTYKLIRNGVTVVATETGTGTLFSFAGTYPAGNYTVIVENAGTCQETFDNTVIPIEVPAIAGAGAIAGNTNVCADGITSYTYSVTLIANAIDYVWTLPVGVTLAADRGDSIDVIFNPSFTSGDNIQVYGDNVTSICLAGNTSTLSISAFPIPTDDINTAPITSSTGVFVVCEGQTGVDFSVNPADFSNEVSFEWQISAGAAVIVSANTTSNVVVDFGAGSATGTIQVRAVNACGTTAWITEPITVNPLPNVSINPLGAGDVITCDPASQVHLNAALIPGAITWLWTTTNGGVIVPLDETEIDPFVSKEGDYIARLGLTTNGLECFNTDTITVGADKVSPVVSINNSNALTCLNSTETLQAIAINVNYNWTFTPPANIVGSVNISNPEVDQPGTYTVIVTDLSNSCTASASETVIENKLIPDILVTTPSANNLTCTNLTSSLIGGSPVVGATFLWTTAIPLATITNDTDPLTATGDLPGIYTLTVSDPANGCANSADVTVIQDVSLPNITSLVKSSDLDCNNPTVDLTASSSSGTDTYLWTTVTGNFIAGGSEFTATATVDAAADYTITVTSATTGCTVSQTETVTLDNSTAVVSILNGATDVITCTGGNQLTLTGLVVSRDAGVGTYKWTTVGGNIILPDNALSVVVDAAGVYTFTYYHSVTGCSSSA
ncbi:MAG: hypothetical protein GQ564_07235, partial [Bacteroidales bacterium]|nr:hypothetical protein [Bacteroidales bacterium]